MEKQKKTSICIVIDNLGPGGTQRQLIEYLTHADRERFVVTVVNLDAGYETLADDIRRLGYEIIGIPHRGFFNPRTLMTLTRTFKERKPDAVHTYLFTSDLYGRIAAKLAGIRAIISSARGLDLWKQRRHLIADRLLSAITDRVIINAESIRPILTGAGEIDPAKIMTIYNGIDLARFAALRPAADVRGELGIPASAKVVGMVSRFDEPKDYETFFAAAREVLAKHPDVYFVAVGEGPQRDKFFSILNTQYSIPIMSHFVFTGLRRDIPDVINAMDVCVLSSKQEGCPNVILEYMACSKPVIASNVGGCPELVEDGKTGYLFPTGDAKTLADKMLSLVNDRATARAMGKNGRGIVENEFTCEVMAKDIELLYTKLTQSKIAYLLSQFPETHETFILRELIALREKGVGFKIFSLKACRDKVIHPEARELTRETIYVHIHFLSSIFYLLAHPLRTISSLFYVLTAYVTAPVGELAKALYVWLECLSVTAMIRRERITHLHSHWATMPTTAAMILNKLTGIPFSFTAHAWDIFISQRGLREKIENAKFVVTCTEYNRRYLMNLATSANKIYLNYHGLEREWFTPQSLEAITIPYTLNPKPLHLLAIGRLVEQKGFEYLIEACAILRDRGINFECSIIGDGPLRKQLELTANRYTLNPKVKFLGMKPQEEIQRFYRESDVFVAPSVIAKNGDRDGIPNVLLEAMAIGLPVVATSVSGIPEAVLDQKTGILVPPKNSTILADAIEYLWKSPLLREKFAINGRKLIEQNFSTDKNIEELIGIFQENGILHDTIPYTLHPIPSTIRVNVLYVIWSLSLGGAERVVINLAKGLDKSKFNPIVCCLNDKGAFAHELEAEGIEVIALHKRGKFDFSILHSLFSIFKQRGIHIAHTHLWGANFWGRIAAKRACVPVIIAHEHGIEAWRNAAHALFDKILYRHTDRVILVSQASQKLFLSKIKSDSFKCRVIYNGVDTEKFNGYINPVEARMRLGLSQEDYAIASIGRLVTEKGHEYLFEAIKLMILKYPSLKVLVAGDGPEKQRLIHKVKHLGVQKNIIFLGARNDIAEILSASDLFVLSSTKEAFPISILEAMAVGRPVVATDVGGVSELISNEKTGFVVPPRNSQALADAIAKLVNNKNAAAEMAEAGKRRIKESFTLRQWLGNIENLYTDLLNEKRCNA